MSMQREIDVEILDAKTKQDSLTVSRIWMQGFLPLSVFLMYGTFQIWGFWSPEVDMTVQTPSGSWISGVATLFMLLQSTGTRQKPTGPHILRPVTINLAGQIYLRNKHL